ncbi:replication initiation protein [Lactobacillus taiwanensis]|uniref:replication initiation protein n=1 Tax=Lactobacillus taiwanensis TaxID=508451 RepID=UPI0025AF9F85|nr:replication initiation protein [Lactobacillus taiwanensis]
MAIISNKKMDVALDNLLSRQDYLVTQANELAKSLGNLRTFEHKVLDYCFSYVTREDQNDKVYELTINEIVNHLGLTISGQNYKRVVVAFKKLNENTATYIRILEDDVEGILMSSLFDYIKIMKDGRIKFRFSSQVAPYIFHLKEKFYAFRLSELSRVRSKYTLALLKLWNANSFGKWRDYNDPESMPPDAVIQGSLEDWQSWFLGYDENGKAKRWPAGRFKQMALDIALKEAGLLYPNMIFTITTLKQGRCVVGYKIDIHPVNTNVNMNTLTINNAQLKK